MNEQLIFAEALAKNPAERDEFLANSCQGDSAARSRVENLIASHEAAGSFLELPALEQGGPAEETPAGLDPTLVSGESSRHPPQLDFLTPSQRPDSLGRLGHYEVLELVGRGGMGLVLRAFDEKLHRVVALKVVLRELVATALGRKRFIREAIAAAQVSHENVVHIHAVEEEGPMPFLVMQFIQGKSLDDRLREEGSLDVKEVLRIGHQIASGLAAAHKQGLIHRDIKPANILLENGVQRVKITDFGLARAADDASVTQTGMIAGTPQYMSPEQAQDQPIDQRSDLFSLGSVMYAMCAGRPPFRGNNTVSVLRRLCDEAPRPLVELNPDVPDWLCEVIDKLLAKQPAERYQTALEVSEVLERHLAGWQQHGAVRPEPKQAPPRPVAEVDHAATTSQPAATHRRRRPLVAAALALLATAAVVAGIIFIQTDRGQFVIETDDPEIAFRVTPSGVRLEDHKSKRHYELKVAHRDAKTGEYELEVTDELAQLGFTAKTFTIKRGEKVAVKAWFQPVVAAATGEWTPLFNGKDLTNWKTHPAQPGNWSVEGGNLVTRNAPGYLFSERGDYSDFHLRAEVRVEAGGNAGIFFRTAYGLNQRGQGLFAPQGYEAELAWEGAVYPGRVMRVADVSDSLAQPGEWMTLEVIARGPRITTRVNGRTAVDVIHPENGVVERITGEPPLFSDPATPTVTPAYRQGHIVLQAFQAATTAEFRKIEIRELPSMPAESAVLAAVDLATSAPLEPAVAPFDAQQARHRQQHTASQLDLPVVMTNSLGMKLRLIPPGEFQMGSSQAEVDELLKEAGDWERGPLSSEAPQRRTTITRPFYLGQCEVTVGEFRQFVSATNYKTIAETNGKGGAKYDALGNMETRPEYTWRHSQFAPSDDHPVVEIGVADARAFCAWLSQKEGRNYALPGEDQWEFACRAGTLTPRFTGDSQEAFARAAWFDGNSNMTSHRVAQREPNPFGLYDMLGNVAEICTSSTGTVVVRGGEFGTTYRRMRSASRFERTSDLVSNRRGFRVALVDDLTPPGPPVTHENAEGAFIVRSRGMSRATATLAAAVQAAESGDTIEIRGNGPFAAEPIDLGTKELVILAGEGFHPVLQYTANDSQPYQDLFLAQAPFALEGVELQLRGNATTKLVAINARSCSLMVTNCRIRGEGNCYAIEGYLSPRVEIRNSLIQISGGYHAIAWTPPPDANAALMLDNCVAQANVNLLNVNYFNYNEKSPRHVVRLSNNTILSLRALRIRFHKWPPAELTDGLHIEALDNVVETPFLLSVENRDKQHVFAPSDAVQLRNSFLYWDELRNVYSLPGSQGGMLSLTNSASTAVEAASAMTPVRSLREWGEFWGLKKSIEASLRFKAGDGAIVRTGNSLDLAVEDFALAPGSPGTGISLQGKDAGADIALVGPGRDFERLDYAAWQARWAKMFRNSEKPSPINFNGTWTSRWGELQFNHPAVTGDKPFEVTGRYYYGSKGVIKGLVDPATRTLVGTFEETVSRGKIRLVISADNRSIDGNYGYQTESQNDPLDAYEWDMTRKGPIPAPQPAVTLPIDFNGAWTSSWGELQFTHPPLADNKPFALTGTYYAGRGKIQGTVDPATRTMLGTFQEAGTGGKIRLILSGDNQRITGNYGYQSQNQNEPIDQRSWDMTRMNPQETAQP